MGNALLTSLNSITERADLNEISTGWKFGTIVVPRTTIHVPELTASSFEALSLMQPLSGAPSATVSVSGSNELLTAFKNTFGSSLDGGSEIFQSVIPFVKPITNSIFAFIRKTMSDTNLSASSSYLFSPINDNASVTSITTSGTAYIGRPGMSAVMMTCGINIHYGHSTYESQNTRYKLTNGVMSRIFLGFTDIGIQITFSARRFTLYDSSKDLPSISFTIPQMILPYWYL